MIRRRRRCARFADPVSYRAGWLASEAGLGWHHNPHSIYVPAHAAWEIGRLDQVEGAKPLVTINQKGKTR
jgi:hypothetical protein